MLITQSSATEPPARLGAVLFLLEETRRPDRVTEQSGPAKTNSIVGVYTVPLAQMSHRTSANVDIVHPYRTQHGYQRTATWFETSGAQDVFDKYLANLTMSAADFPVKVLEVRKIKYDERSCLRRLSLLRDDEVQVLVLVMRSRRG